MIIIPLDKKFSWSNPPFITFLLISLNIVIFFFLQYNDNSKFIEANNFYFRSGLSKIELPEYKKYLKKQGGSNFVNQWEKYINNEQSPWFFQMESDKGFMDALRSELIITSEDSIYSVWKRKRQNLDNQLNNIITWKYSLKAGKPELSGIVAHMFLHGSFWHLFGNMIFLLALGFIIELSLKRSWFLICYFLCGLSSVLLYIPFESNSLTPSIGASGAIAGLMGMYTVLFNIKKIRFFYFIYFYFDYVKLPAIFLLPLWLGFEIYQQIVYSNVSNVNYLAHIGGLIGGALISLFLLKFKPKSINHEFISENESKEMFESEFEKACQYIKEVKSEKAIPILKKLLTQQSNNREVLFKYYQASKYEVGSDFHHDAALRILNLKEIEPAANKLIKETLNEYLGVSKPRLTASLIRSLFKRLLKTGSLKEAEKLLKIMLQQPEKFSDLPHHLLSMINAFNKVSEVEQVKNYTVCLNKNYPNSQEAKLSSSIT